MIRNHALLLAVGLSCLAVGAGASAIAVAGAASGGSAHSTQSWPMPSGHALRMWRAVRRHDLRRAMRWRAMHGNGAIGLAPLAWRAVQGSLVVKTAHGFQTLTLQRGTVDSVSGQQLKLTEGIPGSAYRSLTLMIPAGAWIRDNGRAVTLGDLKAGQRVVVITTPQRTFVLGHSRLAP